AHRSQGEAGSDRARHGERIAGRARPCANERIAGLPDAPTCGLFRSAAWRGKMSGTSPSRRDSGRPRKLLDRVNLPGIALIFLLIALWQGFTLTLGAHHHSLASRSQIAAA